MRVRSDITGQRFGLLTAVRPASLTTKGRVQWLCKCDCGKERTVRGDYLKNGHTRSCGCLVTNPKTSLNSEERGKLRHAATQRWRQSRQAHLRAYSRERRTTNHGLTREAYEEMLAKQNGVCAICCTPSPFTLQIDHDHTCCPKVYSCGRCIRGLLCISCNRALGLLKDDQMFLARAIAYLKNTHTSMRDDAYRKVNINGIASK